MNPFAAIGRAIIRYRRTRGFGVHSPFAFGFITSVLRCRYPFYCWDELEAHVKHAGKMRWNDARALFRSLNQFCPASVYISPGDPAGAAMIVKAWSDRCVITTNPSEAEFLICSPGDESFSHRDVIDRGAAVWFTQVNSKAWEDLLAAMERGQSFTNGVTVIVTCNPKLPRHHFEISY